MARKRTAQHNDDVAISVKNLHKTFRIPLDGGTSLKQKIVHFTKRQKGYREFSPLNGVTFDIHKGEFFGIVGRNGSGKSTLLKTIAGIYEGQKGSIKVNGTLVPFIELGVGFNPELTGRENVFLNGALLGFSRDEMNAMYTDIVEFAELEEFMDERLKNYSSGMQVRLAFSIAIRAKGDILLLDEVLAVGDTAFQQKCYDYFDQLKSEGRTVVLVTHGMSNIEKFCSRALLLNEGKVEIIGSSEEVAEGYRKLFKKSKPKASVGGADESKDDRIKLESIKIKQGGSIVSDVQAMQPFSVCVEISQQEHAFSALNVGISIRNKHDLLIVAANTMPKTTKGFDIKSGKIAKVEFLIDNIYTNGEYYVDINTRATVTGGGKERKRVLDEKHAHTFNIVGIKDHEASLTHPRIEVSMQNVTERDALYDK